MHAKELKMGVIGCGLRVAGDLLKQIQKFELGVHITAICDTNKESAVSRLEEFGIRYEGARFYIDADDMLDKEELDGVVVGTRCSLHTEMAIKVMRRGIPLYLEKPISTSMEDLRRLKEASERYTSSVTVSLPLRVTSMVCLAKKIIDSGEIGKVEHVQAYNNVSYGDVYYQSWYRDENETHGLFIQKAVHDFDYINHILDRRPVMVCAMKSKQIFKGDKPVKLECVNCDEYETCMQSPYVMTQIRNHPLVHNQWCSFAEDTGNEDSGSALVLYEDGMHVAYSQNFFCRNGAAKRGARFFGYKGTLEFDWVQNRLTVYDHMFNKVTNHDFSGDTSGHGGGDEALTLNFIHMMRGDEQPVSPLSEALTANLISIKAKISSENYTFEKLEY
jgi:predicted dehydrogenase